MKPCPRVSVIIPTYQSSATLETCLRSVVDQSYPLHEVIVVDGYSKDGTQATASQFEAKVILATGTQAAARNIGLADASGEYVLFLDSDQRLDPRVVEDCVHTCVSKGVGAVKIPERFVGLTTWGKCSALWKNRMVRAWGDEGGIPRFYRKDALPQSEAYDDSLRFWEDTELHQRLKSKGIKEAWCIKPVTHFEAVFLREVIRKYVSYGKSIPRLGGTRVKAPLTSTIRLTITTLVEAIMEPGASLGVFLGCLFLVAVKALSLSIGLLFEVK